jgi:hypothetical protein
MLSALLNLLPFVGDKLLPRVLPDKDKAEENRNAEAEARLAQFGAEFAPRDNRTWWDSFIDGLNRLPRPVMALGVIALFIWASVDPVRFAASAQAWALIPDEMWLVLGAIVTFFFGDRTLIGMRKSAGPTPDQLRQVLDTQRQIAALDPALTPTPPSAAPDSATPPVGEPRYQREMQDNSRPLSNDVIAEWNRRRKAGLPT